MGIDKPWTDNLAGRVDDFRITPVYFGIGFFANTGDGINATVLNPDIGDGINTIRRINYSSAANQFSAPASPPCRRRRSCVNSVRQAMRTSSPFET